MTQNSQSTQAKSVLVTGCSSGIGRAAALRLARSGFTVFATVRREADGSSRSARRDRVSRTRTPGLLFRLTRLAEELGRKMILNIVMVGFFTAVTKLVGYEAVKEAVKASVPQGTEAMNLKAFDRGYQYGQQLAQ